MKSRWGWHYKSGGPTPLNYPIPLKEVERQGDDYVSWLAKRPAWKKKPREDVAEYARSQAAGRVLEAQSDAESKYRTAEAIGDRCTIRTMRTATSRLHYGTHINKKHPEKERAVWEKTGSSSPTTYCVLIDGRYANSFLTKARAKAWAIDELKRRQPPKAVADWSATVNLAFSLYESGEDETAAHLLTSASKELAA